MLEYKDDKVELYKGDCLEVMKSIPDNSVDLILTDPPYIDYPKYYDIL